jgi:hypothetical protein
MIALRLFDKRYKETPVRETADKEIIGRKAIYLPTNEIVEIRWQYWDRVGVYILENNKYLQCVLHELQLLENQ